jgi:hypothetical protein
MLFKLVDHLIGYEGSLVSQWRRVIIDFPPHSVQALWNRALSRPTPNLHFLKISYLGFTEPILSSSPSLQELIISSCTCTLGDDFDQLQSLEVRGFTSAVQNISAALTARNLTTLSFINCGRTLQIPPSFPLLENVSFTDGVHTQIIEQFSAPRLRSLTIYLRTEESIKALKNCRGIDFQRLETLGVGCWMYRRTDVPSILQVIKEMFIAAGCVQHLRALNQRALRLLLLCIEERIHPAIKQRGCPINLRYWESHRYIDQTFFISAVTTKEDIRRVRAWANTPLDDTWNGLAGSFG